MNLKLFYFINSLSGFGFLDGLMIFSAVYLIWVEIGLFLALWLSNYNLKSKSRERHKILFLGFLASGFGYLINQIIGLFYFQSRPFVENEWTVRLIEKSDFDKSFPSDHTVIAFALALAVFFYNKKLGAFFLFLAALIAFSRIYVGVHYPLDILAGIAVALFSTILCAVLVINKKWKIKFLEKARVRKEEPLS